MTLIRIGNELTVDLSKCSFAQVETSEGKQIHVFFQDQRYSYSLKWQPREYKALKTFLERQESLESYNLRQIREERSDAFNEMPSMLFSLFSSLPNRDLLSLVLYGDGRGCVNGFLDEGQEELDRLYWVDFTEALAKLQLYKNAVSEPVPGEPTAVPVAADPFDIDPFLDEIDSGK